MDFLYVGNKMKQGIIDYKYFLILKHSEEKEEILEFEALDVLKVAYRFICPNVSFKIIAKKGRMCWDMTNEFLLSRTKKW